MPITKRMMACLYLFFMAQVVNTQTINPHLIHHTWPAYWIAAPDTPPVDYGVYFFRKQIILNAKPRQFIVHVSGDNRYKLYVNGNIVSIGPARSDLYYWNYATNRYCTLFNAG